MAAAIVPRPPGRRGREACALRPSVALVLLAFAPAAARAEVRPEAGAPEEAPVEDAPLVLDDEDWEPDAPVLAAEATVEGERRDRPVADRTASVEVVEVDERRAGSSLAELLDEVAGVRVRRLGGLESYSTLSIRGSTAAQVLVLRDGVPLGSAAAAEVDLSELTLADVERVEVYRGPSAAHFGSGGLGGVVNLVGRGGGEGRGGRVELGLGSFVPGSWDPARLLRFTAKRSVSGEATGAVGPVRLTASGSLLEAGGDFTYLDDNGTLWEEGDDFFARRRNNDARQGDLALRAAADLGPGLRLVASEAVSTRSEGVPGYGTALASEARLRTTRSLTSVGLDRTALGSPVPRLAARLHARLRRDEWEDRLGEIGPGREHDDDLTVDLGGQLRAGWPLGGRGTGWLQLEARRERFDSRSLLGAEPVWGWRRSSAALSGWASWQLAGGLVELSPQGRVELLVDGEVGPGRAVAGDGEDEPGGLAILASQQIGVAVRPASWITVRGATGLGQRAPSFLEMLGNRGTVVGNPALRPESGWTVDGGVRLEGRELGPLASGRLELTGFYRLVDDLIQLVPNSQVTFVATNVGGARIAGLEATGAATVDWARAVPRSPWPGLVTVRGGVTFMDAVDASDRAFLEGRQLPLRPRLELFGRVAVRYGPLELGYELDYTSGNYLDPYNSFPVPHRLLHSAEATADLGRWRGPVLTLLASNLTDRITEVVPVRGLGERRRPVADVAGFPLPGLTLLLTARWDLPARRADGPHTAGRRTAE